MGSWLLLIIAVAGTLVLWRVIDVAGKIWRERAHVTAQCASMDAAAVSGAMLCERLPDGTTLLVMPRPADQDLPTPAGTVSPLRKVEPL
jgi:hypothetical protein